ncbi:transcriptional repressor CTCF [Elysia marginata]|uniref:Transcriptional repressor CTCF n=1 Tax=Elysia marginata TaxID=1093978 RepID=A0AAV4EYS0_9GAST|nr:transcriptional repressor CTCF [Elysia marginata]
MSMCVVDRAFESLSLSQAELPNDPTYQVWLPGQGCPVERCGVPRINVLCDMKRHWREKHEEIVAKYLCPACSYVSKRKSNLTYHYRMRHGSLEAGSSVVCPENVEYHFNREYIDPYPLTLEVVLGRKRPLDKERP